MRTRRSRLDGTTFDAGAAEGDAAPAAAAADGAAATPPPPPPQRPQRGSLESAAAARLIAPLSADEEAAFSRWFSEADEDGDGLVSGPEGASFLTRSGLPKSALFEVWRQACLGRSNPALDFGGFCRALRLVALAQHREHPLGCPLPLPNIAPRQAVAAAAPAT